MCPTCSNLCCQAATRVVVYGAACADVVGATVTRSHRVCCAVASGHPLPVRVALTLAPMRDLDEITNVAGTWTTPDADSVMLRSGTSSARRLHEEPLDVAVDPWVDMFGEPS
jgi:hypothetical protein